MISLYQTGLILFIITYGALGIIGTTIAVSIDSPAAKPGPFPLTQNFQPTTSTAAPNTTAAPVINTTTPLPTTTVPPVTYPPLVISQCPSSNPSVPLGSSYDPSFTGGSPLASGGCIVGGPIIFYSDGPRSYVPQVQPANSLIPYSGGFFGSASNQNHILLMRNTGQIDVIPKSAMIITSSFNLTYLCSNATESTSPYVIWDPRRLVWIASEVVDNQTFCVYASSDANPLSQWSLILKYQSPVVLFDTSISVWGSVYGFTHGYSGMCAFQFNQSSVICGTAFNGAIQGVSWMSPTETYGSLAPALILGAGTLSNGIVFMRPIDDELYYSATNTPLNDQIEVEHWYSLNFTTLTYSALRYKIDVSDFNMTSLSNRGFSSPLNFIQHASGQSIALSYGDVYFVELKWDKPTPILSERWIVQNQTRFSGYLNGASTLDATVGNTYMAFNTPVSFGLDSSYYLRYPGELKPVSILEAAPLGGPVLPYAPSRLFYVTSDAARQFWTVAQVSSNSGIDNSQIVISLSVLLQETFVRTWTVQDTCGNNLTCTQNVLLH
jgi:hypothetical protein